MKIKNMILKHISLPLGRMISLSKSGYIENNPNSVVCFNANIVTLTHGKIWFGDLDLTKDYGTLKEISIEIGEPLFILRESDCRFENENHPTSELIKRSVWNTTQEVLFR
jgi:hypothetical protein